MYPSGGFEEVWAWTLYKLSKIFNMFEGILFFGLLKGLICGLSI